MSAQEVQDVLMRFRLPPVLERVLPTLRGDDLTLPVTGQPEDERENDREGEPDVPLAWATSATNGD